MSDIVFRGAVVALLLALCGLTAWCGFKLEKVRLSIPDSRYLPSDERVRDIATSLETIQKDVATIKAHSEPPELAALRRNMSRPPAPTTPVDPGRIIYPPER